MKTHVIIHQIASHDPRLKRHIVHDPKSREYPAKKARAIMSVTHAGHFLPINQGQIGKCTCDASMGALLCDPYFDAVRQKLAVAIGVPNASMFSVSELEKVTSEFYHDETELHPHDGVYPPQDPGGCGLWIAQVLKNRGLIDSYSHAFGIDHALKALVKAPCIFGIDWYSSFGSPDPKGLIDIKPRARVEGGHEICAFGIDATEELVWFWQSWGKWGYKNTGKFCMRFATLDRLLQNQGDCTQFVVKKVA